MAMFPNFTDLIIGCKVYYKRPLYQIDNRKNIILTGQWEKNIAIVISIDVHKNFVELKTEDGSKFKLSKIFFHRSEIYGIESPDGIYTPSEWGHWVGHNFIKIKNTMRK